MLDMFSPFLPQTIHISRFCVDFSDLFCGTAEPERHKILWRSGLTYLLGLVHEICQQELSKVILNDLV